MSAHLDAQQTDLLLAAFSPEPEAVAAWCRWRDGIDWDGHLDGDSFALLPTVQRNLQRLGVDDPLFPRFKGIARQSWLQNQQRLADWKETFTLCERDEIDVLVLPPTSLWFIDSTSVSSLGQSLQFAVQAAQAERAIDCLERAGWQVYGVRLPRAWRPGYVRGVFHLDMRRHQEQTLALSWGLHGWFAERADRVWQRCRPAALGGFAVRTLDPTDTIELILRRCTAATLFASMTQVLTIFGAAESIEWDRLGDELQDHPLPPSAATPLQGLHAILGQDGLELELWRSSGATSPRPPIVAASPLARLRLDWDMYRRSWGSAFRARTALQQLPGYLMGRWRLATPRQLLAGSYRWMRYGADRLATSDPARQKGE